MQVIYHDKFNCGTGLTSPGSSSRALIYQLGPGPSRGPRRAGPTGAPPARPPSSSTPSPGCAAPLPPPTRPGVRSPAPGGWTASTCGLCQAWARSRTSSPSCGPQAGEGHAHKLNCPPHRAFSSKHGKRGKNAITGAQSFFVLCESLCDRTWPAWLP